MEFRSSGGRWTGRRVRARDDRRLLTGAWEATARSRVAEEGPRLARAGVSWKCSEGRPLHGGSIYRRDPVGGDGAGNAQDDPADQQRAAEDAQGSVLHGFEESPRSRSRACWNSSALI